MDERTAARNGPRPALIVVLLVISLCFCVVLESAVHAFRSAAAAARLRCLSNIKLMGIGILMYEGDYDDRMPLSKNIDDEVVPYLRSPDEAKCVPETQFYTAYNVSLSGRDSKKIANPSSEIVLFDSISTLPNPSGGRSLLPPEGRHNGLNYAGFADTHAKVFRVDDPIWNSLPR